MNTLITPGLVILAPSFNIDSLTKVASAEKCAVYILPGLRIRSRADFFDLVRETLPTDPPVAGTTGWDGLSDSLWEGLYQSGEQAILIVWLDADCMKQAAPSDFAIALELLEDISATLSDVQLTVGRPKSVAVRVVLAPQ